jgi:hypothetical protein
VLLGPDRLQPHKHADLVDDPPIPARRPPGLCRRVASRRQFESLPKCTARCSAVVQRQRRAQRLAEYDGIDLLKDVLLFVEDGALPMLAVEAHPNVDKRYLPPRRAQLAQ